MTDRWRCFVAVTLPDDLRASLVDAVAGWSRRPDLAGLRWIEPDAWHVTLAFLGTVDVGDVPDIIARVDAAAAAHEPVSLATAGLGGFPSRRGARVAWYGVRDDDARLAALARDLAGRLELERADRFRPHVTLARARRDPVDVGAWIAAENAAAPTGVLPVAAVRLMRSHLGRGPARYETLASMRLGARDG